MHTGQHFRHGTHAHGIATEERLLRAIFVFTALGYLMRKGGFSIVCLVIGFILGDDLELALRQSILMNSNDYGVFLQSPIALFFFALTLFFCWHFGFRSNKKNSTTGASAGGV